eukprot:CAMPEP_0115429468 /NCGR_PEP_ID=MMETSP0271-20121206/30532_1 /TAXON_ID=71861 /ORGANISM="Scrippsiella trochoidea, Strain CCMP3099" /LENGTH=78 /DNA_ID=CAMNT_0002854641 /DNA_START=1 /DNA_END=234 /DNA_ORIENTATION=-
MAASALFKAASHHASSTRCVPQDVCREVSCTSFERADSIGHLGCEQRYGAQPLRCGLQKEETSALSGMFPSSRSAGAA